VLVQDGHLLLVDFERTPVKKHKVYLFVSANGT
jgi:hypothetical protein